MPVLPSLRSSSPLPCQWSLPGVSSWRFCDSTHANCCSSAAPFKAAAFNHSICTFLALGLCTIDVLLPLRPVSAEAFNSQADEISNPFTQCVLSSPAASPPLLYPNLHSAHDSPSLAEKVLEEVEECLSPSIAAPFIAEDPALLKESNMSINQINASSADLFEISSSHAEQFKPFLDYARVFSPAKTASLLNDINTLEAEAGWRLRVITKAGSAPSISGKDLKDLWKPDDRTVIVIEDISSPNILNFTVGADVTAKLPRQFFLELQSRYGNQFFVQQEGEGEALKLTVQAIRECLQRPKGCKNVPGLTDDLYYLTLVTSIVGGSVFGFAARLPPSGRVEASWQWVLFLSPLWLLLFVSFGVLPVVGRTSEVEPLIKNALGFFVGAFALYLTPIFGPSPISKK